MKLLFPRPLPKRSSAEAGAWLARLHRPDRTPADDAALREWLARHPEHREAFEIGNDLLIQAASLPITHPVRRAAGAPREFQRTYKLAAVCGALAAITLGVLVTYQMQSPELSTETGEQLTRALPDGTRVTLNTRTHLEVQFDEHIRKVILESGEALFDVTKNPQRPFIVYAGGRRVTALGTQFVVRYDEQQTVVTLMEGKVSVQQAKPAVDSPTILHPGERVIYTEKKPPKLDRPTLERVVAWQRGQVPFSKTTLSEAIVEMNRYSDRALILGEPSLGSLRISGLFKVGDSKNFALALANTYPIQLQERNGKIILLRGDEAGTARY